MMQSDVGGRIPNGGFHDVIEDENSLVSWSINNTRKILTECLWIKSKH